VSDRLTPDRPAGTEGARSAVDIIRDNDDVTPTGKASFKAGPPTLCDRSVTAPGKAIPSCKGINVGG